MNESKWFEDTVTRCLVAVRDNGGRPLGVWSTGEQALVALVLWDREWLKAQRYSYASAMDRVAGGLRMDRDAVPGFLDRVRLEVEERLEIDEPLDEDGYDS